MYSNYKIETLFKLFLVLKNFEQDFKHTENWR